MNPKVKNLLDDMTGHKGYKNWRKENRSSEGRFWNLLRADLMGLDRGKLLEYLKNDKNRLNETEPKRGMDGLGIKLKQQFTNGPDLQPDHLLVGLDVDQFYFKFTNGPDLQPDHLIAACLEMDLSCRCKAWRGKRSDLLKTALGIYKAH